MMHIQGAAEGRRPHSRNKKWVAGQGDASNGHGGDGERRTRGGHHRRGGRGRGQAHYSTHLTVPNEFHEEGASGTEDEHISEAESTHEEEPEELEENEPVLETQEEREKFYQEVCADWDD